jgi:hypothetical protein
MPKKKKHSFRNAGEQISDIHAGCAWFATASESIDWRAFPESLKQTDGVELQLPANLA